MNYRAQTLAEIEKKNPTLTGKTALVGFDGFVDKIRHAVDKRSGPGDAFTRIPTIAEFGSRISAAAGKSTNIELCPRMEKLGGNGPIMANALVAAGLSTRYVGTLGSPVVHGVFEKFAQATNAVSVAAPGITDAVEFGDGKILFGDMAGLDQFTYEALVKGVGEAALLDLLAKSDLVAMVNWTMLPYLTDIFHQMLAKLLPKVPATKTRHFFFDLADPEKRSLADIREVLQTIVKFSAHGSVTLGLNLKEGQQIHDALDLGTRDATPEGIRQMAVRIRETLGVQTVVIHPVEGAAAATPTESAWVDGPFTAKPLITTGAGDHFNAGFMVGQLLGLSPAACLTTAVSTSGHYVRTAQSPSLAQLVEFIGNWK
jgi:hypothetical protein